MEKKIQDKWIPQKLEELGYVSRGRSKNRPRNDPKLYEGKYPFFQTGDIKRANLYLSEYSQTYNEKGLAQSKLWQPGTLCITIAANIAETAILKIEGCFPDSVVGFIPDEKKADIHYIKYYLDTIKLQIQNVSKGTTQDNLSLEKLRIFDILTPPLPTQKKIAAILSAYDNLIENNTRRIKILEEMAQALYREWFVEFRFPGHEDVEMVDDGCGRMIPEGWEYSKLEDVCTIIMGQSPKSEYYNETGEGLPFHQGVTNFGPRYPSDKIYCTILKRIAKKGDILFSVRAPVGRLNIANNRIILGRGLSAIRNKNGNQIFTYYQLKEIFKEEDIIGGGTIFKAVTKEEIQNVKFLQPSNIILNKFERIVSPIDSMLDSLYSKNHNLTQTRDLLLPRLIEGEVDVSELDIAVAENNGE
ncbi:restriction endonuclease subunit S [Methanomicrobium antiquum]|uniref:Restriction endonuclease subunit S n=1 Tax=Methanomicrobium antiquum TaxID=487686 RepID=A0AAF0JN77_9EURY|nr:restriction endonuclease subunit S [Methanomicrobium antiquum]WFN37151.1 restriction endonuclease subunit S [Methanomicrobium antiquum]